MESTDSISTTPYVGSDSAVRPVFVIGDVHGNLDRLEALLLQEGIIGNCPDCDGLGDIYAPPSQHIGMCPRCDGDGTTRIDDHTLVVQAGDLGHFGEGQSPTGDTLCYDYAHKGWIDVVLWGNHDRAIVDDCHAFKGFWGGQPEVKRTIKSLHNEGRMQLAFAAHGFLITHAGLHLAFQSQPIDDILKTDVQAFVDWINDEDDLWLEDRHDECNPNGIAIRDALSKRRGGKSPAGGLLWRDIREKLYPGFRQIFGHSADWEHQVRYCWDKAYTRKPYAIQTDEPSYCIDIGGKGNYQGANCLAGIWLPSERIARVDL